jgi:predicted O-methyltransferase YrrM
MPPTLARPTLVDKSFPRSSSDELRVRPASPRSGLLAADDRVTVLSGDARALLGPHAPFDLLFADGGWRDPDGLGTLVGLIRVGGQLVMDDVTPLRRLPPESPLRSGDVKRELFFGDARLCSVEVVLPDLENSLLVGTRLS